MANFRRSELPKLDHPVEIASGGTTNGSLVELLKFAYRSETRANSATDQVNEEVGYEGNVT